MTAGSIARELHGRKSGAGWSCRCPAHDDREPSLSIREVDGKVLVHCHAGCDQQTVVDALRSRGLWPESNLTPHQKRHFARQRRQDQVDMQPARLFGDATAILAEECLETLDVADPQRRPLARLLAALRTDAGMLAQYRRWKEDQPKLTRALVVAGRKRQERVTRLVLGALDWRSRAA